VIGEGEGNKLPHPYANNGGALLWIERKLWTHLAVLRYRRDLDAALAQSCRTFQKKHQIWPIRSVRFRIKLACRE